MLIILSPAKIQNFKPQTIIKDYSLPAYTEEAHELIEKLLPYSAKDLESLLHVNSEIARRASDSYYNWSLPHTDKNAKQAIMSYNGEVYRGLDAKEFSKEDFEYAQKHLRILSGLYGVLRPLDLIQPYRLEMNTQLNNGKGNNLYAFWEKTISSNIASAIREAGQPEILINLASKEYSKDLQQKKTGLNVINFDFLENRYGDYKPIVIYTKKARGLMAQYIIRNKINNLEGIKSFSGNEYCFNERLSSDSNMVFTR